MEMFYTVLELIIRKKNSSQVIITEKIKDRYNILFQMIMLLQIHVCSGIVFIRTAKITKFNYVKKLAGDGELNI